jgi:short-subunit dehydrogenase
METAGTALVTGASTGIGRELARVFAAHGHDLVVVARRADRLESLADELLEKHGRAVRVMPRDLLEPGGPQAVFAELEAAGVDVDVLVNDAGVLELGAFHTMEVSAIERIIELNARVLTTMTRLFVPGMRARGHGRVLNVASAAAFQPIPSLAVYAASKAFVLSLTEALSEELSGSGVTVTAVCPGLTTTDMTDKAKSSNDNAAYFPDFLMADAASVARDAYAACVGGRVIEVPGLTNRVLTDWSRLQPRWVTRMIGGLVGRRFLGS